MSPVAVLPLVTTTTIMDAFCEEIFLWDYASYFFVVAKIRVEKCMDEHNVVMCEKISDN